MYHLGSHTLNEHLTLPSFLSFSFPPINHFHSAINQYLDVYILAYISLVLCILLIQLTKVHGPKRPALLSIFCYAKLRKISESCTIFLQNLTT